MLPVPPDRGSDHDLNRGPSIERGLVIAAEWVGTLTSLGPGAEVLRFAPGGKVHAYDAATGRTLCGVQAESLELFRSDFHLETTGDRCRECARVARATS